MIRRPQLRVVLEEQRRTGLGGFVHFDFVGVFGFLAAWGRSFRGFYAGIAWADHGFHFGETCHGDFAGLSRFSLQKKLLLYGKSLEL